jgi:hypothetical protein
MIEALIRIAIYLVVAFAGYSVGRYRTNRNWMLALYARAQAERDFNESLPAHVTHHAIEITPAPETVDPPVDGRG